MELDPKGEQTEFEVANPTAASSSSAAVDEASIATHIDLALSEGPAGADVVELVTMPRPKMFVLGRALTSSSVAEYIWVAVTVAAGLGWMANRSGMRRTVLRRSDLA